ncbi:hypothetical protein Naga_100009g110 [Nannochloropsis gaditana]|uniref:Uncharacterized protein n=1 Tax=Nannochloropsis gaditana TaxID=72520 RepID=W7TYP1_9STRA|nr:hypothetical protein Naga_100009g110 [Nannochloropsis gaditana]
MFAACRDGKPRESETMKSIRRHLVPFSFTGRGRRGRGVLRRQRGSSPAGSLRPAARTPTAVRCPRAGRPGSLRPRRTELSGLPAGEPRQRGRLHFLVREPPAVPAPGSVSVTLGGGRCPRVVDRSVMGVKKVAALSPSGTRWERLDGGMGSDHLEEF